MGLRGPWRAAIPTDLTVRFPSLPDHSELEEPMRLPKANRVKKPHSKNIENFGFRGKWAGRGLLSPRLETTMAGQPSYVPGCLTGRLAFPRHA